MRPKIAKLIEGIAELATCNPFSPQRFALEKKLLGKESEPFDSIAWHRSAGEHGESDRPNVLKITELAAEVVDAVTESKDLPENLTRQYWSVATYLLLYRHITNLSYGSPLSTDVKSRRQVVTSWELFWKDCLRTFDVGGNIPIDKKKAAHLFACLIQVHRAFFSIFDHILGASEPIAKLREQVWESVFSCNMFRYHDHLFQSMKDLSTLITGPSGTGKELVARAIGLSQYVPFDPDNQKFEQDGQNLFLTLNLSALSPTLIESELFGHCKGAFTGAVSARKGWLETCSPCGSVFLDEIGELSLELQVKLLRVLQQRTYYRLGDTAVRRFEGKIVAATNRDLELEIAQGNFREDFYFRICTDRIQTPALKDQLASRPEDLEWLVESILDKQNLSENITSLAGDISGWISENLGDQYSWPGNIRELEQCVGSFLIRGQYVPLQTPNRPWKEAKLPDWLKPVVDADLTADEVLCRYCTWVYFQQGTYEKVAQIVKLDRRTVKSKIDAQLLEDLRSASQGS